MSGSPSLTGGAGGAATSGDIFNTNSFGARTYNKGSGRLNQNSFNPWLIGGIAAAALVAVWMLKKR